ncbi:MAG: 2-C-methyl-D-erythritol 4-phosphate cytidylyltransferase [Lachnospiraceae bacterium]|nr:2-C-methyl-D-erythritol 4-phosphate cytidylyltransferase [Lachnospiraceae bacterium]
MSNFAAVVLSAGSGKRMKSDIPKQYMNLLGKPVIYYSLKAFQDCGFSSIVLVCGKDDIDYCRHEIIKKYDLTGVTAIVAGGKERYHSVYQGLRAVGQADYVFIHDGARSMINEDIIRRLQGAVVETGAAVAGMPVKDTINIVDSSNNIESTPERKYVWQVQTPQCFAFPAIYNAYEKLVTDEDAGIEIPPVTDDAMVLSYVSGQKVKMVEADYRNIKITTPEDLSIAELFLGK